MKKILITGAGGFVGTYLIKELQSQQAGEIYGTVYHSTSDISSLLPADHILEGDLTDPSFAQRLIETTQPDHIYHLAAISVVSNSFAQALTTMQSNTTLSYNLLENVRLHAPHSRFIAVCSANVYGAVTDTTRPISESTPMRPLNPYAVSKATQELLALQYHLAHGLDTVILRPFNHTGIGQTVDFVIPRLASQFAQIEQGLLPPTIQVGNLESIRDFTDVRDMVKAYVLAATHCQSGEIYNIGSGQGVSVREIIQIFQSLSATKVEISINNQLVRAADVPVLVADYAKFKQITQYAPSIPLTQTISDILNSYRTRER